MVGEIRDLETAEIAIQAALTGHLVFSTLHTNDAPGAVTRLQDMGCEPYLLSSVLERRARPAARCAASARSAGRPTTPIRPSCSALGVTDAAGRRALPRQGLRRLPRHGLPRAHRHLRAVRRSPRKRAASSCARRLRARSAATPSSSGMVHAARGRAGPRPCAGLTTVDGDPAGHAGRLPGALGRGRLRRTARRTSGARRSTASWKRRTRARSIERLQRGRLLPDHDRTPQAQRRGCWASPGRTGQGRVAGRDLVALTQQLATLRRGRACRSTARSAIQAELAPTARSSRAIMADVLRSVRGGASLADALAKHHPRPFSRLYINMVRAGEKGGVLESHPAAARPSSWRSRRSSATRWSPR